MKYAPLLLLIALSGCAIRESSDVDMCKDLKPGQSRVMEVRAAPPIMGYLDRTWPWVRQHALVSKRMEAAPYTCMVELENPSGADLMSVMSSPISAAFSHTTLTP
jgi:hypothetical protein